MKRHLIGLAWVGIGALILAGGPAAAENYDAEEVFELCAQCHGPDGGGDPLSLAPAIAGMPEWYVKQQLTNFRSGARGTHPDDLGGLRMYPMALTLRTDEQIAAMSAYVASMPAAPPEPTLEGGDAKRGAQLYATCTACHGPKGAGNQALNAPPLVGASDWYLLTSLQKFKVGARGSYPNAVIMQGMSAGLVDDQAIKDVIAYIATLSE